MHATQPAIVARPLHRACNYHAVVGLFQNGRSNNHIAPFEHKGGRICHVNSDHINCLVARAKQRQFFGVRCLSESTGMRHHILKALAIKHLKQARLFKLAAEVDAMTIGWYVNDVAIFDGDVTHGVAMGQ